MTTVEKSTYCRICEPMCGLIATVEDGKLVKLRADKEDPHTKGFFCTKGVAMTEVVNDPDRLQTQYRDGGVVTQTLSYVLYNATGGNVRAQTIDPQKFLTE